MAITANEVALASVLTTALIGGVSGLNTWRDRVQSKTIRTEDRAHERELAHDARTYEGKRDTYISMLEVLEAFGVHMQRTEPIGSTGNDEEAEIPPLPTITKQMPLLARIETLGSNKVYEMYRDFVQHTFAFSAAVGTLRTIRIQEAGTQGMMTKEAWDKVEALRTEGRQKIERIAEEVRRELGRPGGEPLTSIALPGGSEASVQ